MKSGEKRALEPSNVAQAAPSRVPASVEGAYERGWQWHLESFANLRTFGDTIEGVTRREGLAHFKGPQGGIVIPFVATYAFGEPRVPKYPYAGGSVCLIDDDEEHAATLERKPSLGIGEATVQGKQSDSDTPEIPQKSPKEIEKERTAIWRIKQRFRGRVIFTYTHPEPETKDIALDWFSDAFCDELQLEISEVKIKTPSVRRRTKKAKPRR